VSARKASMPEISEEVMFLKCGGKAASCASRGDAAWAGAQRREAAVLSAGGDVIVGLKTIAVTGILHLALKAPSVLAGMRLCLW